MKEPGYLTIIAIDSEPIRATGVIVLVKSN